MSNPSVQYAAQNFLNTVHWGCGQDQIAHAGLHMVQMLGGQPEMFERLTPDGRLLYIIALVAAQP